GNDANGYIDDFCVGRGPKSSSASAEVTFHPTEGFGGNTNASGLTLRGGLGYGAGTSGDLIIKTGDGVGASGVQHGA
ncbi:hypothetical protein, partial [Pseudomonas syringae group genomosp. 7]|uniref:hypothetical protein n=1 Tax=Pseudomonas syringae group genomosp. 7 TaxID=251699 RepID=UPI00376FE8EA